MSTGETWMILSYYPNHLPLFFNYLNSKQPNVQFMSNIEKRKEKKKTFLVVITFHLHVCLSMYCNYTVSRV